ncbi:hypothetical protein M0657_001683 [Pyricularia oryzae]|nr:hypothetical protein M9X92_001105 [Pyricularia oryzae]KAI7930563.1 hypothetical protein M0657_001683 [Pyricularia oryzae]
MGWTRVAFKDRGWRSGTGALEKQKQKIKELSRVITIQAHEAFAQQHAGNITSWLSPGVLRQWQNLRRFGRYGWHSGRLCLGRAATKRHPSKT